MIDENRVKILGFGVAGYRSFHPMAQALLGPLRPVTVIVGQNNCGKSNLLRFAVNHLNRAIGTATSGGEFQLPQDDLPQGAEDHRFSYFHAAPARLRDTTTRALQEAETEAVAATLDPQETGCSWFGFQANQDTKLTFHPKLIASLSRLSEIGAARWSHLAKTITRGGGSASDNISRVIKSIAVPYLRQPKVELVPDIRGFEIGGNDQSYSGLGLIGRLNALRNPSLQNLDDQKRFRAIQHFVRQVVGDAQATLSVDAGETEIQVTMNGRVLNLLNLGTGIREVVTLATAATVIENSLVCIEEPELHLHPILQARLLRYLHDNTSNQYLITTHSAHLINPEFASIFHVQLQDGWSTITPVATDNQRAIACYDLGYRPNDLLQANAIVWVEGPSDRIYLRHWLSSVDPELEEGLHYSIMFYGGKLLSHLSADDRDVDDFIRLRRINRNMVIVMDLDRDSSVEPNDTKQRVRQEFTEGLGFGWVTKGREIENYIPAELLEEAIPALNKAEVQPRLGDFDHVWKYDKDGEEGKTDKMKLARWVAERPADLSRLDLRTKMDELAEFIRAAN